MNLATKVPISWLPPSAKKPHQPAGQSGKDQMMAVVALFAVALSALIIWLISIATRGVEDFYFWTPI